MAGTPPETTVVQQVGRIAGPRRNRAHGGRIGGILTIPRNMHLHLRLEDVVMLPSGTIQSLGPHDGDVPNAHGAVVVGEMSRRDALIVPRLEVDQRQGQAQDQERGRTVPKRQQVLHGRVGLHVIGPPRGVVVRMLKGCQ